MANGEDNARFVVRGEETETVRLYFVCPRYAPSHSTLERPKRENSCAARVALTHCGDEAEFLGWTWNRHVNLASVLFERHPSSEIQNPQKERKGTCSCPHQVKRTTKRGGTSYLPDSPVPYLTVPSSLADQKTNGLPGSTWGQRNDKETRIGQLGSLQRWASQKWYGGCPSHDSARS